MCYDRKPERRPAIVIAAELARSGNGEAGGLIRDLHDENARLRAENEKLRGEQVGLEYMLEKALERLGEI